MPAKKKPELPVAPSATSKEEAKSAKRIEVGDWIMFASPYFVQSHLVAKPRDKDNVKVECGLSNPPDFTGRALGPRCKRCDRLRDVTAK